MLAKLLRTKAVIVVVVINFDQQAKVDSDSIITSVVIVNLISQV